VRLQDFLTGGFMLPTLLAGFGLELTVVVAWGGLVVVVVVSDDDAPT
jgi:hypothetical protein